MTKIRIPVLGAHEKRSRFPQLNSLSIIPVMGMTLLVGFLLGRGVFLPKTDPHLQVGAALESTRKESPLPQNMISDTPGTNAERPSVENPVQKNSKENTLETISTPLPSPESLLRMEDLDLSITDHEAGITQLNEEIARIKSDSVALVSMWSTNCGNWKDDCAKPYAATLEINNNSYSELVQKVTKLQRELDKFRAEKTARL